jgi:hypothetical protein
MAFWAFLLRRFTRHWQPLLTVAAGVVLATALLASVPMLVDASVAFSLPRVIAEADPLGSSLRLRVYVAAGAEGYDELDNRARGQIASRLSPYVESVLASRLSYQAWVWVDGDLLPDHAFQLRWQEGIEERITFVEGGWPDDALPEENVVAAVIGENVAADLGLRAGDRLALSYQGDAQQPDLWLEVSGIARPRDASDPYWYDDRDPLNPYQQSGVRYDALLPAADFEPTARALFPRAGTEAHWRVIVARDAISVDTAAPLLVRLGAFRREVRLGDPALSVDMSLDALLADFLGQAGDMRAPLYMLAAEIVLLVLYYVVMMAALATQDVEDEFATMRSRGADSGQLFRFQLAEAAVIGGAALLIGPAFGALLVRGLTLAGPLADIRPDDWPVHITGQSWLAAAVGAALSVVALLLSTLPVLRRSVVTHLRATARQVGQPWWQRAYLDVFVLLAGVLLIWRLVLYRGAFTGATGGAGIDWLVLLSPLALVLGAATILLRLFPLLLGTGARLVSRRRGLVGALALWHAARQPDRVIRLILLFTLAMALAVFATGLNAALDVSEMERARYAVGADLRVAAVDARGVATADILGVSQSTTVLRSQGSLAVPGPYAYAHVDVLGVNPQEMAATAWYRADYAAEPMEALLSRLSVTEDQMAVPTLVLPGQPSALGLWLGEAGAGSGQTPLLGESDLDRVIVFAKLRTNTGSESLIQLAPGDDQPVPVGESSERTARDWRHYSAAVSALPPEDYPLELVSLWFRNDARTAQGRVGDVMLYLTLDDITVLDAETQEVFVAEDFEGAARIWTSSGDSRAFFRSAGGHAAPSCLELLLRFPGPHAYAGVQITSGWFLAPMPALVSRPLLESANLQVGDALPVWVESLPFSYFRIVGVLDYFPTLYQDMETPFIVTNRDLLMARLSYDSPRPVNPNEVWLRTGEDGPAGVAVTGMPGVTGVWDVSRIQQTIRADPLALGLRGVTFFGYVLTGLLSLVGFATYFTMDTRRRAASYGILRAMGASAGQIYRSLVVEQVVLILTGLVCGSLLGLGLNRVVLPGFPITLGGRLPVPPFRPVDDWLALGKLYAAMAGALFVSLGVATALLWRARVHRVLRIGQE